MLIQVVMITTHISCNWLFIYGHWGFPRLGVRGAGIALASSIYVGTALYFFALARYSSLRAALRWNSLRADLAWFQRILRIGIPASVQAVIRTLGMMSFTGLLAHTVEASAGVAAMQIGIRAEAMAFMPGFGYSVAASALVGQSLGARNPLRAERAAWAATYQAIIVMVLMATLFYSAAPLLAGIFTGDPLVRHLGIQYLRTNAFCEPFLALGMVLTGALQGAGDTVRPTYITFFTMWIVRMPLAWMLMFTLHMQTLGAWYSMMATTTIGGLMTLALFRSGKWKKIKV
jgi:putative MATE family efflux protein